MYFAFIPLLLMFVALSIAAVNKHRKMLDFRLAAMQRQLDRISTHLNVEVETSKEASIGVMELIQAGQKIPAIKAYREKTGAGLAEAKKAVEDLAAEAGLHI